MAEVAAPVSPALTSKDFVTDQEVRWCPGRGLFHFGSSAKGNAHHWCSP